MIYLYIYIAFAIMFAVYHTITYSKNMDKVDPRVKYLGKLSKALLIVLTFIISVVLTKLFS